MLARNALQLSQICFRLNINATHVDVVSRVALTRLTIKRVRLLALKKLVGGAARCARGAQISSETQQTVHATEAV